MYAKWSRVPESALRPVTDKKMTVLKAANGIAKLADGRHEAYAIGFADGTFRPQNNITRAQVAQMLYRLDGDTVNTQVSFVDVPEDAWYHDAVCTLAGEHVLEGYSDGTFRPDTQVTRAELATIIARYCGISVEAEQKFCDVADTHWARQEIACVAQVGFLEGYIDGTFRPDDFVTRVEMVTLINCMLERDIVEEIHEEAQGFSDVPEDAWYYSAILEAANTHDYNWDFQYVEVWTAVKQAQKTRADDKYTPITCTSGE